MQLTRKRIQFRTKHPTFRRGRWFQGQPIKGMGVEDIGWFLPDGSEMTEEHWNQDFAKSMAVFLNGQGIRSVGPKGEQIIDDSFYIIFNAHHEPLDFRLPSRKYGTQWTKVIDTISSSVTDNGESYKAKESVTVESRTIIVLRKT